jgi:hypothetical protein
VGFPFINDWQERHGGRTTAVRDIERSRASMRGITGTTVHHCPISVKQGRTQTADTAVGVR